MGQSPETPHQIDLFTRAAVDNRTQTQKERDRQRQNPQQDFLFSQREMAQFGVNPKPLFSLSPHTSLVLVREDPRSEMEKDADRQRAAEARNARLFEEQVEYEDFTPEAFMKAWVNEVAQYPDNMVAWLVLAGLGADLSSNPAPMKDKVAQVPTLARPYRVKQTPQGHRLRQPIMSASPACYGKLKATPAAQTKYLPDHQHQEANELGFPPLEGEEVFDFTDEEQHDYVVSDERFQAILQDERLIITQVAYIPQPFGDFLYIRLSSNAPVPSPSVVFYGLGYHTQLKRWYHQTWCWSLEPSSADCSEPVLGKDLLQQIITRRRQVITPNIAEYTAQKECELDTLMASLKTDATNASLQHQLLQTIDDLSS